MRFEILLVLAAIMTAPALAADSQDRLCLSPMLTRQEQDLCRQQIAAADTVNELRQIQKKFRDRIRKAEEARKAQDKK